MSVAAKFTLPEYHRMIESGAFVGLQKRIELFRGELRMMSPQGAQHAEVVSHLSDWSYDVVDRNRIRIRIQLPVEIAGLNTEPEPDVVWADAKRYVRHPQPQEILLLIEVAESSLFYDLGEKCDLYAEAGIREYWVFDVLNRIVHTFREPHGGKFREHQEVLGAGYLSPRLVSDVSCSVNDLFACLED
jgi:Uma2 family endonuclease